jgi:hypothetical protein
MPRLGNRGLHKTAAYSGGASVFEFNSLKRDYAILASLHIVLKSIELTMWFPSVTMIRCENFFASCLL